jgi:hypothetical protein
MNLYTVTNHDSRIVALHGQGLTPLEIAVKMSDVLVGFGRPTEGYVKARLLALGLQPHRSQRALRYGKCNSRANRRKRAARKELGAALPVAA